jgi:hypothetical protein
VGRSDHPATEVAHTAITQRNGAQSGFLIQLERSGQVRDEQRHAPLLKFAAETSS